MHKCIIFITILVISCHGYLNHGPVPLPVPHANTGYYYGAHPIANSAVQTLQQVPSSQYGPVKSYNLHRDSLSAYPNNLHYSHPSTLGVAQHGGYIYNAPGISAVKTPLVTPRVISNAAGNYGHQWQQSYSPSPAHNSQYAHNVPRPYVAYPVYQHGSYSANVHHNYA